MLKYRLHRCCALIAVIGAMTGLFSAQSASAEEPQYATVALLVGPDTDLEELRCIVFDGPVSDTDDSLVIENTAAFEPYSGADLYSTDAMLIGQGGPADGAVRGVDAVVPSHGVMLLGPNSDAEVELCEFVYLDGSTVRHETIPEYATYLLVIITGQVH